MIAGELYRLLKRDLRNEFVAITERAVDRLLTTKEAAQMLGISVQTLYHKRATIPHVRVGRCLRFSEKALYDYLRIRN